MPRMETEDLNTGKSKQCPLSSGAPNSCPRPGTLTKTTRSLLPHRLTFQWDGANCSLPVPLSHDRLWAGALVTSLTSPGKDVDGEGGNLHRLLGAPA